MAFPGDDDGLFSSPTLTNQELGAILLLPTPILLKLEAMRKTDAPIPPPYVMEPPFHLSNSVSRKHTPPRSDQEIDLGIRRLGKYPVSFGGSCDVWKGEMTSRDGTKLTVALKILRFNVSDERVRKRAERETIWKLLQHENITPFFGIYHLPNHSPVIISQWYENGTASNYLRERPSANPLSIIREIASGVEYLHSKGIVHGDLKGSNVLIDDNGHARLIDFGLCRFIDQKSGLTTSTHTTLRWCAPELLYNNTPRPTMSSDVYSFASTVLELLTGSIPYGTLTYWDVLREIAAKVSPRNFAPEFQHYVFRPAALWAVLEECWSDPARRPHIRDVRRRLPSAHL